MSEEDFKTLNPEVPLALLPVRLEARFLPQGKPTELLVRIFPDTIHADGHDPALSDVEVEAGHTYWRSRWALARDDPAIAAAQTWLATVLGGHRALWVADQTRPTNLVKEATDREPTFGTPPTTEAPRGVVARLLPDRWVVRLYDDSGKVAFAGETQDVPEDLPMAPNLAAVDLEAYGEEHKSNGGDPDDLIGLFMGAQGLGWMVDFAAAEKVGMALRIPMRAVPDPVSKLIVAGVLLGDGSPVENARAFDDHMTSHYYSRGLDVLAQGTATNASDDGRPGVVVDRPDPLSLFEVEARSRPLAPVGRAALLGKAPATMLKIPAADALSLTFGRLLPSAWDKIAGANSLEGLASWAMGLSVGYATIGGYLSGPLSYWKGRPSLSDQTPDVRDWYADWVRGAGPLPAIRVGEQPYGILPITSAPATHFAPTSDFTTALGHHLSLALPLWLDSLPVAALDPDATDGLPGSTPRQLAGIVAAVMGAVPHPTNLRFRQATDHTDADSARFVDIMNRLTGVMDNDWVPHTSTTGGTVMPAALYRNRKPWIDGVPNKEVPNASVSNISLQITQVELLKTEIGTIVNFSGAAGALEIIDYELLPLLRLYQEQTSAMPGVFGSINDGGALSDQPVTVLRTDNILRITGTSFAEETEPVEVLVSESDDLTVFKETLDKVIATLENLPSIKGRRPLFVANAALLAHLLDATQQNVPNGTPAAEVLAAVRLLRAGTEADPQALGTLERLLRESLGVATHRLDAWITSIATQRLAEKRLNPEGGLQVGGYGWLLDLAPSAEPSSQGFIHAPSMDHAATAAVLRAGWNGFGSTDASAPLSVDLTSSRVRGALWILDGVRNGQDLSELLGARFERYLHDDKLDRWIDTIRTTVASAAGRPVTPSVVTDGLLLARAMAPDSNTELEEVVGHAVAAELALSGPPAKDVEKKRVSAHVDRLTADLDAVADVTMTQAVHTLLKGNLDAAGAALAISGGSDAAVPPITFTQSQRDSNRVTHRIAIGWSGKSMPSRPGVFSAAEPRLTGWIEEQLPPLADVGYTVEVTGADGQVRLEPRQLRDSGLLPADVVVLAGDAGSQLGTPLGRVLVALETIPEGASGIVVDTADEAEGRFSVDELGVVAVTLANALGSARELRVTDLMASGTDPEAVLPQPPTRPVPLPGRPEAVAPAVDNVNRGELLDRFDRLGDMLDDLVGDLGSTRVQMVKRTAVTAVTLGIPGALEALEKPEEPGRIAAVKVAVQARIAESALAPGAGSAGSAGKVVGGPRLGVHSTTEELLAGVRARSGWMLPILPTFAPVEGPSRKASLADARLQAQVGVEADRWLRQVGTVRANVGLWGLARLMTEMMVGYAAGDVAVAQTPPGSGRWAAVNLPGTDDDVTCVVSLNGSAWLEEGTVAGLLIDGWSEGIPKPNRQTGIAVHVDAPASRPPSAVLVSVLPAGEMYSADEVFDQLLHTIELAKIRAIAPDGLSKIGHSAPAVYLPDNVTSLKTEVTS